MGLLKHLSTLSCILYNIPSHHHHIFIACNIIMWCCNFFVSSLFWPSWFHATYLKGSKQMCTRKDSPYHRQRSHYNLDFKPKNTWVHLVLQMRSREGKNNAIMMLLEEQCWRWLLNHDCQHYMPGLPHVFLMEWAPELHEIGIIMSRYISKWTKSQTG